MIATDLALSAVLDVARQLRHGGGLRERRAEDVRVALLRDVGRLAAGEVGDFGFLGFGHADDDRAGEHRSHDDVRAVVDGLLRQRLRDARIGLRVERLQVDLASEDAAGRVDLLDRQLDAVVEVGAGGGAAAGQFDDVDDLDRAGLRGDGKRNGQRQGRGERPDGSFHCDSSFEYLFELAMPGSQPTVAVIVRRLPPMSNPWLLPSKVARAVMVVFDYRLFVRSTNGRLDSGQKVVKGGYRNIVR